MPKERNKADGYREKAYEGDTKAMNNLGVCYERGTGVKVNLEMAFEWYMKAAETNRTNKYEYEKGHCNINEPASRLKQRHAR